MKRRGSDSPSTMPTLCDDDASMGRQTAQTSDMAWIVNEFGRSNSINDSTSSQHNNDSTMSGSFLVAALKEMQPRESSEETPEEIREYIQRKQKPQKEDSPNPRDGEPSFSQAKAMEEEEEDLGDETREEISFHPCSATLALSQQQSPQNNMEQQQQDEISARNSLQPSNRSRKPLPRKERERGPNEMLYRSKYESVVHTAIQNHKRNQNASRKLRDYKSMNDNEKEQEQQRVANLLSRLRIADKRGDVISRQTRTQPSLQPQPDAVTPLADNSNALFSPQEDGSPTMWNDDSPTSQHKSAALFSPPNVNDEEEENDESITRDESKALFSPEAIIADSKTPAKNRSSIEIPRSCVRFRSPQVKDCNHSELSKKRLASRSGKRSTDKSRLRFSDDDDNDLENDSTPVGILQKSLHRLSFSPGPNFPTSQSPILHQHSSPMNLDSPPSDGLDDVSFGNGNCSSQLSSQSPAKTKGRITKYDSSSDEDKLEGKGGAKQMHDSLATFGSQPIARRDPLRPLQVGLKKGAAFHYNPLQTELCTRRGMEEDFPDPFQRYPKNIANRLRSVHKRVRRIQRKRPHSVMVFSLSENQIIDMSLKTVLSMETIESSSAASDLVVGNTIVVVRDKQWIEAFGQAFREGSSLSVLDHCSLPVKDRKSPSNTEKFSKYGVVLTTFEALKSNDTTLPTDSNGGIVLPVESSQGGWHASRNGSQNTSESPALTQCSILHRIQWNRVVIVDILGRKSFLAKSGTSRHTAAKTLCANSRLIFFHSEIANHRDTAFGRLLKSDKKVLPSICSVLRLSETNSNETYLEDVTVDAEDY